MVSLHTLLLLAATALTASATALPSNNHGVISKPGEPINNDPCATVRCGSGTVCEAVQSKAKCVAGTKCGPTMCSAGEVCCNSSCGICTGPNDGCIQMFCETPAIM